MYMMFLCHLVTFWITHPMKSEQILPWMMGWVHPLAKTYLLLATTLLLVLPPPYGLLVELIVCSMQNDAMQLSLRYFWWLFFVAFWRGNTFVRYEEEEEGYKNEFASCLHAHACCIVYRLGLSWCCFLGLVLDLVLGLQILPPHLLWFTDTLLGSCCKYFIGLWGEVMVWQS